MAMDINKTRSYDKPRRVQRISGLRSVLADPSDPISLNTDVPLGRFLAGTVYQNSTQNKQVQISWR